VCNRLEESCEYLGSCKVGLLASYIPEIALLFEPYLEGFRRVFEPKFVVK
jgi:hypothetical protein